MIGEMAMLRKRKEPKRKSIAMMLSYRKLRTWAMYCGDVDDAAYQDPSALRVRLVGTSLSP